MRRASVLLLLAASAFGQDSRPATPTRPAPPGVRMPDALARVVMLGASVTEGFAVGRELLDQAIRTRHEEITTSASGLFGANPRVILDGQVRLAVRREATLVIALDALFWFLYQVAPGGKGCDDPRAKERSEPAETAAARLALLEKGLALLARIEAPLVLGEIPDMREVSIHVRAEQIPGSATLRKANERIHAWAKERGNVLVLPLASWTERMRAGELALPKPFAKDAEERFAAEVALKPDRLHPSPVGQVLLAAWLVTSLRDWLAPSPGVLALDPGGVRRTLERLAR